MPEPAPPIQLDTRPGEPGPLPYEQEIEPGQQTQVYEQGDDEDMRKPPVCKVLPSITGDPITGQAETPLHLHEGTWRRADTFWYSAEVFRNGGWTPDYGAGSGPEIGSEFPEAHEVGYLYRLTVQATNAYGTATATSAPVGPVTLGTLAEQEAKCTCTVTPVISGTLKKGNTLTATHGTWTPGNVPITGYETFWYRRTAAEAAAGQMGERIEGSEETTTYALTAEDVGYQFCYEVRPYNISSEQPPLSPTAYSAWTSAVAA